MRFDEAVVKKAKFPREFTFEGEKMAVYVVPLRDEDFQQFLEHFLTGRINLNTAKYYSQNDKFTLKGISKNKEKIRFINYTELSRLI